MTFPFPPNPKPPRKPGDRYPRTRAEERWLADRLMDVANEPVAEPSPDDQPLAFQPRIIARIVGVFNSTENVPQYSWRLAVPLDNNFFSADWSARYQGSAGSSDATLPAWETSGNTRVPIDGSAVVELVPSAGGVYYSFNWPERYTPALIVSGTGPAYAWEEAAPVPGGSYVAMTAGRTGTVTVNPAYDVTGAPTLPEGTPVWLERGYGACPDVIVSGTPTSQEVAVTNATGGTWALVLIDAQGNYQQATGLAWNINAAALQSAIQALPGFAGATVTERSPGAPFQLNLPGITQMGIGDPFRLTGVQEWLFQGMASGAGVTGTQQRCFDTCSSPIDGSALPNLQRWCITDTLTHGVIAAQGLPVLAENFPCLPCACGSGSPPPCPCCIGPTTVADGCPTAFCLTVSGVSATGTCAAADVISAINGQFTLQALSTDGCDYYICIEATTSDCAGGIAFVCWNMQPYVAGMDAYGVPVGAWWMNVEFGCPDNEIVPAVYYSLTPPSCTETTTFHLCYVTPYDPPAFPCEWVFPSTLSVSPLFNGAVCGSGSGSGGTGSGSGTCCGSDTNLTVNSSLGGFEVVWDSDNNEWTWTGSGYCSITNVTVTCSTGTYIADLYDGATLIGTFTITSAACHPGILGSANVTFSGGSCNGETVNFWISRV